MISQLHYNYWRYLLQESKLIGSRWPTARRRSTLNLMQSSENCMPFAQNMMDGYLGYHLIASVATKTSGDMVAGMNSPAQSTSSSTSVANSDISSGRHSRASSSSSSGFLSDGGTASESAFDCEFPKGKVKRKPSMKPNIPLTWMTRQLKEMVEKRGEGEGESDEGEGGGDSDTLTRRPRTAHADDSTLKRQHTIDSSDTASVYSSSSNGHLITSGSPVRRESLSPSYVHYETILRDNAYRNSSDTSSSLYGYSTVYDTVKRPGHTLEELPLPPPPTEDVPDGMFSSTLSLDSLPPPPPPLDLVEDLCGSQLSLPPPPPEHTMELHTGRVHDIVTRLTTQQLEQAARAGHSRNSSRSSGPKCTSPRQLSLDSVTSDTSHTSSIHSDESIFGLQTVSASLIELQSKKLNGSPSIQSKLAESVKERSASMKKVNFADEPPKSSDKKSKKILFNLKDPPSLSPRKPPPPKRNESTRLSSPKKLVDSNSNPPKEFLKDLQRVMRKKWHIAQKCKLEPATTPHEVLGFREYPLSEDYKETSVSMWVQEHYGGGVEDPFYENVLDREGMPRREEPKPFKKRSPPAPPRRSESTHLSTRSQPAAVQPT